MLWALLSPMILGLERSEPTHLLRQNGVVQSLTGLPRSPDATTLRRFLLGGAPTALPHLRRLHDRFLTRRTARPPAPSRLLVAVDSPVLVVSGTPAQARIGSTPLTRGRPSYPPLRCVEGRPKDCWPGALRAGDAHTARGTLARLTACFATRPAGVRLRMLRADKGVYDPILFG